MIYLLGVVLISSRTSKWPALFTTIMSVAAFDFFFVPCQTSFGQNRVKQHLARDIQRERMIKSDWLWNV